MIADALLAAWLGGVALPPVGFVYPDRSYGTADGRFTAPDPLRASVSPYVVDPDPLGHPDYSGAAPVGVGPASAIAALYYDASSEAEDISRLSTISEATLETSNASRSCIACTRVTMSTRDRPSPLARRYLSDYSVIHDAKAAVAAENLIGHLPANFSVSDHYLRQYIGHEPIDSLEAALNESPDGSREVRNRMPRRTVNSHRPLERQNAILPPKLAGVLPTSDTLPLDRPGDSWRSAEAKAADRERRIRRASAPWLTAGTSLVGAGLILGSGYMLLRGLGVL